MVEEGECEAGHGAGRAACEQHEASADAVDDEDEEERRGQLSEQREQKREIRVRAFEPRGHNEYESESNPQ